MVESTSTNIPIVLALGKLGEGKSTVGNMLAGSPGGYLVEDERPSGCTQGFDSLIFGQDFVYYDSPGLNDCAYEEKYVKGWLKRLEESPLAGKKVALCLYVIRNLPRYDKWYDWNLRATMRIIEGLGAENVAVVVTHCDEGTVTRDRVWLGIEKIFNRNEISKGKMAKNRMYLFKGHETDSGHFKAWIEDMLPPNSTGKVSENPTAHSNELHGEAEDLKLIKAMLQQKLASYKTQYEEQQKQVAAQQQADARRREEQQRILEEQKKTMMKNKQEQARQAALARLRMANHM